MPQKPPQTRMEFREEAKIRYRDKKNVEAKWLDQYGNISREDDYQRNRACLSEIFNMLDIVMELRIEDFRRSHVLLSAEPAGPHLYTYTFEGDDGNEVVFRSPTVFARRAIALRAIGYTITDDLFYGIRLLRNETAHGNQTVILSHMKLGYDDTLQAMLSMADTLIELGMLDPELRTPSFELLRIHEGDSLGQGAYTIGPLLGEGGMSRVYAAVQSRIGRRIAIKELKPDTYAGHLIQNERRILLRLHHELIPQIHDMFYENGTWYIAMSYVDGIALDQYVRDHAPLSAPVISTICRSLLDILQYLHSPENRIVFADLSPDNILIDKNAVPHLVDFGIASQLETRQTLPAATLGYSAPELFSNSILDQRADLYSFGYILRYLYTGLSPLEKAEEPTAELISDAAVADVINRCTAKNPEERYASAAELYGALFPEETSHEGGKTQKRLLPLAVAGIILAACLAGTGIYALQHRSRPVETQLPVPETMSENNLPAEKTDSDLQTTDAEKNAPVTRPADTGTYEARPFSESGLTDHVMDWKDARLEQTMKEITGITDRKILLSDVWDLQELYLYDCGISDISSLTELPQLTALFLGSNPLDAGQLSGLSSLKALTVLDLSACGLTDISFLREMPGLQEVYLGHNRITDLTPLRDLPRLSMLELQFDPLAESPDASAVLSVLTGVTWLDLKKCGISDIRFLENMTELTYTDLSGNGISDLTPLASLTKLQYLDISDNSVAALDPLRKLTDLQVLYAFHNSLTGDLHVLSGMSQLTDLDLHGNHIFDVSALAGLTSLRMINLEDNEITDLSPLEGLHTESLYY